MAIPSPKEVLLKIAEIHDTIVDTVTRPVREVVSSIASSMGMPTPPEPPRMSDIVESLPDIELPTSLPSIEQLVPFPKRERVVEEVKTKPSATPATTTKLLVA